MENNWRGERGTRFVKKRAKGESTLRGKWQGLPGNRSINAAILKQAQLKKCVNCESIGETTEFAAFQFFRLNLMQPTTTAADGTAISMKDVVVDDNGVGTTYERQSYGKKKQIFMASIGKITDLSCRLNAVMPLSYECNWFVMEKCELWESEGGLCSEFDLAVVYVGKGPNCTCCSARIPMRRGSYTNVSRLFVDLWK